MTSQPPNILFILVDQMRYAPAYPGESDDVAALYQILRFQAGDIAGNPWRDRLRGFCRLRENGVSLQNHTISSAACVASRATIMTGQYSARTGVEQTEGMFKVDTDPAFPWLPSDGVPTMGDWFRAAGYDTHYFGRWDLSNPPQANLQEWGFADWEYSYPSDQRFGTPNLGVFRDKSYTDLVTTFLRRKALGVEANVINSNNATNASFKARPWLAVASFVNPHDIGAYPFPWRPQVQLPASTTLGPYGAPPRLDPRDPSRLFRSNPPTYGSPKGAHYTGTWQIPLNPDGFAFTTPPLLPPNRLEDLAAKPTCQADYAIKFQLALQALRQEAGLTDATTPGGQEIKSPYPFQLQSDSREWYQGYLEFYLYLQYLVNLEVDAVLQAFYECGLDQNTIVVFTSDHGEMAGAHGGQLEKWHQAYQESIHVPAVVSWRGFGDGTAALREVHAQTTHVDWIPTLLGLAGFRPAEQETLGRVIRGHDVYPLVGEDVSPLLLPGSEASLTREGVLFVADDTITEPLDANYSPAQYTYYQNSTASYAADGVLAAPGAVVQPNHVQSYFERPWKLVKYWDPVVSDATQPQWELYNLDVDPTEDTNLVTWSRGEPVLRDSVIEALGLDVTETAGALKRLTVGLDAALARAGFA